MKKRVTRRPTGGGAAAETRPRARRRKKNPGRRELLDAPRAEEPRRIRGQKRAPVEQRRRDLLGRAQSAQVLQVRPGALWPPPSAAAEDLSQSRVLNPVAPYEPLNPRPNMNPKP